MELSKLNDKDILVNIMKEMEQIETPSFHHFTDGLYTRETHMSAGTLAVGEIHRFKVTNILVKGHISVINGDEICEYKAPCIFTSEAGVSKIAYFHEDTIWLNCHPTTETDLDKIRQQVIISEQEAQQLLKEA